MCEAIRIIRNEAEIKGETRGETRGLQILVSTLKELGHDDSVILDEIVKRYKLSRVAAEKYLI